MTDWSMTTDDRTTSGMMIHGIHRGRQVTVEFDYDVASKLRDRAQAILDKAIAKRGAESRMAQMYAGQVEAWLAVLITPELLTDPEHELVEEYINHVLYDQRGFDRMFGAQSEVVVSDPGANVVERELGCGHLVSTFAQVGEREWCEVCKEFQVITS